jgi:hypothetical protein
MKSGTEMNLNSNVTRDLFEKEWVNLPRKSGDPKVEASKVIASANVLNGYKEPNFTIPSVPQHPGTIIASCRGGHFFISSRCRNRWPYRQLRHGH